MTQLSFSLTMQVILPSFCSVVSMRKETSLNEFAAISFHWSLAAFNC